MNGTRARRVAEWAMRAMSIASCTELEQSRAKPVLRVAITSLWSPKMDSPWAASERAATWKVVAVSSPAILNILGIMSSRPCEAVKVVVSAPVCSAPWTAPAAPPSDCISMTRGTAPQMLVSPWAEYWSANSPMPEEGVIG